MKTTPYFSVIIPVFNRERQLQKALQSLANQTFKDFEVIVCDDGSTDKTESVARAFENTFNLVYSWEAFAGGPAGPRNRGISLANGDWVCFLDSDDFWYPDKLEALKPYTKDYDFLYHNLDIYDESGKFTGLKMIGRQVNEENVFQDLLRNWNAMANSSVLVRKSVLKISGNFDTNQAIFEDFDLWLRIARVTNRFKRVNQTLGGYSITPGNFTSETERCIQRDDTLLFNYKNHLSPQEFSHAKAVLFNLSGIRYLESNDRAQARKHFARAIRQPSGGMVKLKALAFLIFGKFTFRFVGLYRFIQDIFYTNIIKSIIHRFQVSGEKSHKQETLIPRRQNQE